MQCMCMCAGSLHKQMGQPFAGPVGDTWHMGMNSLCCPCGHAGHHMRETKQCSYDLSPTTHTYHLLATPDLRT